MSKSIYEKKYITEAKAVAAAEKAGLDLATHGIVADGKMFRVAELAKLEAKVSPRQEFEAKIRELQAAIPLAKTQNEISNLYMDLNQLEGEGLSEAVVAELDEAIGHRAAQIEADAELNKAQIKANSDIKAGKPWVRASSVEKPTKMVWFIADEMYAKAEAAAQPMPSRKEVQDECVKRGIASGTARTQFQHWFKCRNESATAERAQIIDGKIVPAK